MKVEELKEVSGVDRSAEKYIVCVVTDRDGGKKLVIRAGDGPHSAILSRFRVEAKDLFVECIGGGHIMVYPGHIDLHGSSSSFGPEPDRSETMRILQKEFPEFMITMEE